MSIINRLLPSLDQENKEDLLIVVRLLFIFHRGRSTLNSSWSMEDVVGEKEDEETEDEGRNKKTPAKRFVMGGGVNGITKRYM